MKLQEKLDRIREGFEKKAPAETLAIMHRATDDLRASGQAEQSVKEGEPAPPFDLEESRGERLALQDLLARGPLVLTFFRGNW